MATPPSENVRPQRIDTRTDTRTDTWLGQTLLDRYAIVGLLGEGGMGRVYLADQKMGTVTRKVAVKVLHPEHSRNESIVKRFYRESETVVQLTHPNTIQFYDFGEAPDGTLFIVMEFLEGSSLSKVLEDGPMPPDRVQHIVHQVCGALQEAHALGIVHRDLKPDNIILTQRGGQTDFVKLVDFGIAKFREAEDIRITQLTQQGMVLGTPPYMSPEQFLGHPLDARTDVYSLGVVVYEMLTGTLPFEANTAWEWAHKHVNEPPTSLHEQLQKGAGEIPAAQEATVMAALSKDPIRRPATAMAFLSAFEGVLDDEPMTASVTKKKTAGPRATSSKRRFWLLGALLAVTATVALFPLFFDAREPKGIRGLETNKAQPGQLQSRNSAKSSTTEIDLNSTPTSLPASVQKARPKPTVGRESPNNPAEMKAVETALDQDDIERAIALIKDHREDFSSAAFKDLRGSFERKGSNTVGIYMQEGKCAEAQRLYRALKEIEVHHASTKHFSDWCRLPDP